MTRATLPTPARRAGTAVDSQSQANATRDRLLTAAIDLFAEHGFDGVTVRQICQQAGANIAAVNYHFRDKLGLYLAVLGTAIEHMRDVSDLTKRVAAHASAEERFRHYVRTYLHALTRNDGPASWIHRLMRHETTNPTPAAPMIFDLAIRPRLEYLSGVIGELIGCPPDDPRVTRCVISVHAQCLIYRPDPFHAAVAAKWPVVPGPMDAITDHIINFSLAGIRGEWKASEGHSVQNGPPSKGSHRH
jgi:TetR/AcrR family transcriptional regulator, regulator of cefoperazone and chloramphenicol sensitivity